MYQIVFLLLGSFLCISCSQNHTAKHNLPFYNEPTFTPIFENDKYEIGKKVSHTVGNFSCLNQDSVVINQAFLKGRIHVANFIFTACGSICPTMTKHLKLISDSVYNKEDIILLSYSVTPWIDKPHVLKKYKERNGIENKNWHFLTGNKGDIYKLARQSYFAEEDIGYSKDSTEFLHTEHFVLVDKRRRIRGIYNGTLMLEMHQLLLDIRILSSEE